MAVSAKIVKTSILGHSNSTNITRKELFCPFENITGLKHNNFDNVCSKHNSVFISELILLLLLSGRYHENVKK